MYTRHRPGTVEISPEVEAICAQRTSARWNMVGMRLALFAMVPRQSAKTLTTKDTKIAKINQCPASTCWIMRSYELLRAIGKTSRRE